MTGQTGRPPTGPPPGPHPGSPPPAGPRPVSGAVEEGPGSGWRSGERWAASGRGWQAWAWSSPSRPVPWFGAVLLVLGVGLLIEQLIPELTLGSLLILGLGIAFAVAWLAGRVVGATVPALVLLGWAIARIGGELGYLGGDGWELLFVGLGLLLAWGVGRVQGARREWALVLGAILAVIGLADAADSLPFAIDAALIIPVAMIAIGVWLIWRRRLAD